MKAKLKISMGIAMLLLSFSLSSRGQTFRRYEVNVNGIAYRIDPRIELFNTVAMQFGHNGMTQSNIPYKQEALEHFTPFKNHAVVDSLLNTWKLGWGVDDPIFFMLSLDSNFHLMDGLDPYLIKRGGGQKRLEQLAALFGDFARKSGFYTWFNDTQRPFYQEVIRQTAYNLKDFRAVSLLENYYGEKKHAYIMVLNLMGGYGNFGHAFIRNGKTDLYAVVETRASAGSVPVFSLDISLFTLIIHEFSHGFVNPSIDPYIASVAKDSALYEPIKDAMRASGYQSWGSTVYETVVPAAVCRMAEQFYGKAFADKNFYKQVIGKRFIYADTLIGKLKYYEKHRSLYPQFKSFVPELLSVFDHISADEISRLQQKVEEMREPDVAKMPKPWEYAYDSTTYVIIGTHEPDQKAQEQMQAWARKYHDMIARKSPIITDDEALEMNLAGHDIILFGTPEGNSLLHQYISTLPITILKDSVLTNKIITGNHLQVVTAWVNPFDNHKAMVIYTAQQTIDIYNYNSSSYKDQSGYWVGENTITLDKGEYVNYWKIWECDPL